MAEMTPQVSEVLERAMTLSTQERGLLIDRLIESLDEQTIDEGVEGAWAEEIKRRVDDVRLAKIKMIAGEQVLEELAKEFPDEKAFRLGPAQVPVSAGYLMQANAEEYN